LLIFSLLNTFACGNLWYQSTLITAYSLGRHYIEKYVDIDINNSDDTNFNKINETKMNETQIKNQYGSGNEIANNSLSEEISNRQSGSGTRSESEKYNTIDKKRFDKYI